MLDIPLATCLLHKYGDMRLRHMVGYQATLIVSLAKCDPLKDVITVTVNYSNVADKLITRVYLHVLCA